MIYQKSNNEYINLYAQARGIREGDPFDTTSYFFWIDTMHNKFQKEVYGREVFNISDKKYVEKFVDWVKKQGSGCYVNRD